MEKREDRRQPVGKSARVAKTGIKKPRPVPASVGTRAAADCGAGMASAGKQVQEYHSIHPHATLEVLLLSSSLPAL